MSGRTHKATSGLTALLLMTVAGCVDLDVQNPNAADAERALGTASDVEALISGAYGTWDNVVHWNGPTMFLSNAAGQHAAPWANFGMEEFARIPRIPTNNVAGGSSVGNVTFAWFQAYRAISAVRDGLKQIADGVVDLGDNTLRAQAYGKFMQGLAHASIAVLYDSGFVYDETMDPDPEAVTFQGYEAVMTAARGYFEDAIGLASGASFTIPAQPWFGSAVTAADLVKMAHSERARFYASVARTPAERQALDWNAIRADAQAGFIDEDWEHFSCDTGSNVCHLGLILMIDPGWSMQNNWVVGMADVSGNYQAWINTPTLDKQPFLIVTPDTRWPQGADEATQEANPGDYYGLLVGDHRASIWQRPDRGTWRWSFYTHEQEPFFTYGAIEGRGVIPTIRATEMEALIAEADFYAGNMQAVADFVNETRTQHGLQATDASGTNTDCVPRLPNGSCGDLWEMFKWEKRLETQFAGVLRVGFYFDGRGWGDLMEGTMLQLPVPFREMELLEQRSYNFGGVGGVSGAPVGTYGY
jgi:hypothetical protein